MSDAKTAAIHALQEAGFSAREATFLFLVGTHTGIFTMFHWRLFRGTEHHGGADTRFLEKLIARKFAARIELSNSEIVRITSKVFYRLVGYPNSRLRRLASASTTRRKLITLEYVLRHPDRSYLCDEAAKLALFRDTLGIPASILPQRIFTSASGVDRTAYYFHERFPIYSVREHDDITVGIVYADDPRSRFHLFRQFVASHQAFFARIPRLRLTYVSPNVDRRRMASEFLHSLAVPASQDIASTDLIRYFTLRRAYEAKQMRVFQPDDYIFWRGARDRYAGPAFDAQYRHYREHGALPSASSCAQSETSPMSFEVASAACPAWASVVG